MIAGFIIAIVIIGAIVLKLISDAINEESNTIDGE